ncbi:MAG TPA: hypothetical protein VLS85_09790 [Hanamia sp.]|nr:hypothetical protein [Hanamia sp.]
MITLPEIKIDKPDRPEIGSGIYSLGLVIPFQPSMADMSTIKGILNYTLEVVQIKLEGTYETEEIKAVINRLKRIFSKLNYNSHRKSVAIIIEGEEEKVIYLNYSGKPIVYFNDPFSLLDLVADSVRNPEFEILVLNNQGADLYEYFNNSLHKVFAQKEDSCIDSKNAEECLLQRISNIIKLVNKKNDKPVFIFSEKEEQTNKFCKFFPFREIVFKINASKDEDITSKMKTLAAKIISQWDYWQSRLVKGQITIAKRSNSLFSYLENVTKALKHSNDGLLLIDCFMKEEIHKTLLNETLFVATKKLTDEIEKFLARGNRIEITEGGLLENFGGIALIKDNHSKFQSYREPRNFKEEDFMT